MSWFAVPGKLEGSYSTAGRDVQKDECTKVMREQREDYAWIGVSGGRGKYKMKIKITVGVIS